MKVITLGTRGPATLSNGPHALPTAFRIEDMVITASLDHDFTGASRIFYIGDQPSPSPPNLIGVEVWVDTKNKDLVHNFDTGRVAETYCPIPVGADASLQTIALEGEGTGFIVLADGYKYVFVPHATNLVNHADLDGAVIFWGDGYTFAQSKNNHSSMKEQIEWCDEHNIQRIVFSSFGDSVIKVGDKYALRNLNNILPPPQIGSERSVVFARDGQSFDTGLMLPNDDKQIDLNTIDFDSMSDSDILLLHMHTHQLLDTLDPEFLYWLHDKLIKEMNKRGFSHESEIFKHHEKNQS